MDEKALRQAPQLTGVQVEQGKVFKADIQGAAFWGISDADLFLRGFSTATMFRNLPNGAEASEPPILASVPFGKGRFILYGMPDVGAARTWQAMKLRRVLAILAANAGVGSDVGPGIKLSDEKTLYPESVPDFDPYRYWRW
jgi:hypothetical protein